MPDEFKAVHGFYLNVAHGDGQPSIFLLPVFPENVAEVKPKRGGGSSITVRTAKDETDTLEVTQGADFIAEAMRRCKALDEGDAAPGSGARKT